MPKLIRWMLYLSELAKFPVCFTYRLFMWYENCKNDAGRSFWQRNIDHLRSYPARRRRNFT